MDETFALELEAIGWFADCGQAPADDLPLATSPVGSWPEAIERCSDLSWEATTLEASNRLTLFLHTHHRDAYQRWNEIVAAAKQRVVTSITDRVWAPFAERHGFGRVLVDCASWDVLGAVMEHEYRCFPDRPEFFSHLLRVYRAGHFPCGWVGAWPAGHLLIW